MPYCVVATITYGKLPVNGVNLDMSLVCKMAIQLWQQQLNNAEYKYMPHVLNGTSK